MCSALQDAHISSMHQFIFFKIFEVSEEEMGVFGMNEGKVGGIRAVGGRV